MNLVLIFKIEANAFYKYFDFILIINMRKITRMAILCLINHVIFVACVTTIKMKLIKTIKRLCFKQIFVGMKLGLEICKIKTVTNKNTNSDESYIILQWWKNFLSFLVLNLVHEEKQIHSVVYDGTEILSLAVFFFQH